MSNPPGHCEPTLDTALLAVTFGFATWLRDTIISDGIRAWIGSQRGSQPDLARVSGGSMMLLHLRTGSRQF